MEDSSERTQFCVEGSVQETSQAIVDEQVTPSSQIAGLFLRELNSARLGLLFLLKPGTGHNEKPAQHLYLSIPALYVNNEKEVGKGEGRKRKRREGKTKKRTWLIFLKYSLQKSCWNTFKFRIAAGKPFAELVCKFIDPIKQLAKLAARAEPSEVFPAGLQYWPRSCGWDLRRMSGTLLSQLLWLFLWGTVLPGSNAALPASPGQDHPALSAQASQPWAHLSQVATLHPYLLLGL